MRCAISNWLIAGNRIFVSYMKDLTHTVLIFDFSGKKVGEMPSWITKRFA